MNLERRLQHAARELREVEMDVPPLAGSPTDRRRPSRVLQAAAVPMLFVAGGLFTISGVRGTTPEPVPQDSDIISIIQTEGSDAPGPSEPADVPAATSSQPAGDGRARMAPPVQVELQMIADNQVQIDPDQPLGTSDIGSEARPSVAVLGPI